MHELSITQSILEIALKNAQQAGAKRVVSINLVLGALSSAVDDSIQFYWELIAADTIAQDAQLHFERVPAEMLCRDCGQTFEPDGKSYTCPKCLSPRVRVSKGEELRIESIDIE